MIVMYYARTGSILVASTLAVAAPAVQPRASHRAAKACSLAPSSQMQNDENHSPTVNMSSKAKGKKNGDVISALRAFETTLRASCRHSQVPVYRPLLEQLQQHQDLSQHLSQVRRWVLVGRKYLARLPFTVLCSNAGGPQWLNTLRSGCCCGWLPGILPSSKELQLLGVLCR